MSIMVVRTYVALATLCCLAAPAYAGSGGSALDSALTLAFGLLAPVAGAVGVSAARWLHGKTRLDLTQEIQAGIDHALGLAEQRARQHLARSGAKLPSDAKLKIALDEVATLARRRRWPAWVRSQSEHLLESRLGLLRMRRAE